MSASAGPERGRTASSSLRVFINYRREDSADAAGRLFDSLSARFANVFMDIDTIEPGVDFVEVVHDAVGSCDVLLALIGRHWLNAADARGRRRLEEPHDFVGLEIKTALDRNVRVIPILLQGAEMPATEDLPEPLQGLARRNALEVSQNRWRYDVGRLIEALDSIAMRKPAQEGVAGEGNGKTPLETETGLDSVEATTPMIDTEPEAPAATVAGKTVATGGGTDDGRTAPLVEHPGVDGEEPDRRPGRQRQAIVAGIVAAVVVVSAIAVVGWKVARSNAGTTPSGTVSASNGLCSPVPDAPGACASAQLSGTYVVELTPAHLPSTEALKPNNEIWGSEDPDAGDTDHWDGQSWYFTPTSTTVEWTVEDRPRFVGELQPGGAFVSRGDASCGEVLIPGLAERTLELSDVDPGGFSGTLNIRWDCPDTSKSVRATFGVTVK